VVDVVVKRKGRVFGRQDAVIGSLISIILFPISANN
jgi:hypothetical protein